MKKLSKLLLAFVVVFAFNSCEDGDNVVYELVDNPQFGAALRTINVNNSILNSSDPTSTFSVDVEEQDAQDGGLLQSVDVHVAIKDLTPDNGTTTAEAFVKSIPAADFTAGPFGLPRATITATFAEAVAAMGLGVDDYYAGDLFVFELKVVLTDGRVFGASSAGASITGGFFKSPYSYNTLLSCNPQDGDYVVDMHDSYGDGWQGEGIEVELNGSTFNIDVPNEYDPEENTTGFTEIYDWSETVSVPVGSTSLSWTWLGDDYPEECSFEIYAPGGALLYAVSEPANGLLPVILCVSN